MIKTFFTASVIALYLTGCVSSYKTYSDGQVKISRSNQKLARELVKPFASTRNTGGKDKAPQFLRNASPDNEMVQQDHVGLASVNYETGGLDVAEIPVVVVNGGGNQGSEVSYLRDLLMEQERTKQVSEAAGAVKHIVDKLVVNVEAPYNPEGNINTGIKAFLNPLLILGWKGFDTFKTGFREAGDTNTGAASMGGTIGPGSGTSQPNTETTTSITEGGK